MNNKYLDFEKQLYLDAMMQAYVPYTFESKEEEEKVLRYLKWEGGGMGGFRWNYYLLKDATLEDLKYFYDKYGYNRSWK